MKALLKRQEGFTLIELLAVMAIVGVLSGIVAISVSGRGDTSKDVQTQQDATTVGTAVADFFSAQEGASILIPRTVTVFEEDINITTDSHWPEIPITANLAYGNVFQETGSQIGAISLFDLAQIHRRDDYAAAERAIGAREGDGPGTIWGRGGPVSVFSCRGETL